MRKIISNEWQKYIRTHWLLLISLSFFIILLIAVFLGNYQTKIQTRIYKAAKQELRNQWESIKEMNPHSAAHYGTYVFKPTNALSSIDDGVSGVTGNVLRVEGHVQNEIVHSEASQMQAISKFGKLKSSLLLQYVIPILLIFLAFSAIHSEKQSGRLKLILLQKITPYKLIFAKTISVWLFGVLLLLLTIATYSILNLDNSSSDIVSRTFFLFFAYSCYYFIITGITIFFTVHLQNTTIALTSMIGIWILWTIFLPSILLTSIEKQHKLPSRNEFSLAMKDDRAKGIDGHNPADKRGKALEEKVLKEYGVDSLSQLKINFDGLRMQADEEYGNKVWDKHFGNLQKVLEKQKENYQIFGFINPFISLQNTSMGFAGNDNFHHNQFLLQVENYRRDFIKTLNDKHAYGGSKTGDWGWKADNAFFKSIPDFEFKPISITSILTSYTTDLICLIGWSIATNVLLFFGAKKMQIL